MTVGHICKNPEVFVLQIGECIISLYYCINEQ